MDNACVTVLAAIFPRSFGSRERIWNLLEFLEGMSVCRQKMARFTEDHTKSSNWGSSVIDPTLAVLLFERIPFVSFSWIVIHSIYIAIMPPKKVKKVMTLPINVIFSHLQVSPQFLSWVK